MIRVTAHAVERAIERCGCVDEQAPRKLLTSPAVETAAAFGAPYVKLGTGQRIALKGSTVVTHPQTLSTERPRR